MLVFELTEKEFSEKVLKSKIPVMVDFWGSWCAPCRMLGPVVEELAKHYEGKITVGKVETDKNEGLAKKYNIMSIPCVVFFKEGKEVERLVGLQGEEEYEKIINKILNSKS